jgi:cytochrome c556
MRTTKIRTFVASLLVLGAISPLLAAPADQVRIRVASYKALGAAFKAVNDAVRAGDARSPQFQNAVTRIQASARQQYTLFPRGSGPQPGVKTSARAEIWSQAPRFRAAQDAFARQANAFSRAAGTGNVDLIRTEARKLGATCKGCHDSYRDE